MPSIKLGNFMVGTTLSTITVGNEDSNSLAFSAGEAAHIKELVGLALRMESLPTLPKHIDLHLFQVHFHEDNYLVLTRTDAPGEVKFTWLQGDEMITSVEEGYKMLMNERQVGSAFQKPVSPVTDQGEPFI